MHPQTRWLLAALLLGCGPDRTRWDASRDDAARPDAMDGGALPDAIDASPDGPLDAMDGDSGDADAPDAEDRAPAPPRPVAPLTTARVTSQRPTLRWKLAPGTDGARVELCRDRACTQLLTTLDASGEQIAPSESLPTGTVFWRLRGRAGERLGEEFSPTWQMRVGARSAPVDTSWGAVLDLEGDGLADLVVGCSSGATRLGLVYRGGPAGLPSEPSWESEHLQMNGLLDLGLQVGDLDGDGYVEVLGAWTGPADGYGRIEIFRGGPSGSRTAPDWVLRAGWPGPGVPEPRYFPASVAAVGDINGDGYGDLLVGGGSDPTWAVQSYQMFAGGPTGPYAVSTLAFTAASLPDEGPPKMGPAIAAGDVNGDGFADVLIGDYRAADSPAYVLPGSPSGLRPNAATVLDPVGPVGMQVVGAGDVNGDGYADLFGVAPVGDGSHTQVAVYHGGPTGPRAVPDASVVEALRLAQGVPVPVGDLDGDGYADVAIAYWVRVDEDDLPGRVRIYRGGAAGLLLTEPVDIADGYTTRFGWRLGAIGDLDGDGRDDFWVGVPDCGLRARGCVDVYRGRADTVVDVPQVLMHPYPDLGGSMGDWGLWAF